MCIKIVNVRKIGKEVEDHPAYRYIGRGSVFGNPFRIGSSGSREEVIAKYAHYLADEMSNGGRLEDGIFKLIGIYLEQGELFLGCYCAPQACHGVVIRRLVLCIAHDIEARMEEPAIPFKF